MIDTAYTTINTLLNKENNGYVDPREFNPIANMVQSNMFRSYLEDVNREANRDNRGLINSGHGNLTFNTRQKLGILESIETLEVDTTTGVANLPEDLLQIVDRGVTSEGEEVEEIKDTVSAYLLNSSVAPNSSYKAYDRFKDFIVVYPKETENVSVRYLRKPSAPNWTFITLPSGQKVFDSSNPSYQDLEIPEVDLSVFIIQAATYFGLNLREGDVIQFLDNVDNKTYNKDNS